MGTDIEDRFGPDPNTIHALAEAIAALQEARLLARNEIARVSCESAMRQVAQALRAESDLA